MSAQTNSQAPASHHTNTPRRVLIVGGVAGGASCAARLRRLDETVEILMIDRGPYVSFANCGLPYYVGNVISDERRLLVASREMFHERFNIDVRTDTEVTAIDPNACTITTRDVHTGSVGTEHYDALVLSPGAAPIRPPLPGINLPGVFAVRTIPDSRRIRSWITEHNAKTAVVIGGGFIGLEMVENLIHRELSVSILEKLTQVMPPLDPEMAVPLMEHLAAKGGATSYGRRACKYRGTRRWRIACDRRERRAFVGRSGDPGDRRTARNHACEERGSGDRPARRHCGRCADAYSVPHIRLGD